MKATTKTYILFILLITFTGFVGRAQQAFEGIIEFKKVGTTDTTYYSYIVKGNRVRIDELNSITKRSDGTFLLDLENKTQLTINHERKLYMDKSSPTPTPIKGVCDIKKTGATKTIHGYKCQEILINNKEEETKITYYLADDKFAFFNKLLSILNRRDKSSLYFLKITEPTETFPMLSIQTDWKGRETGRLEVTKINKRIVDPALFEIPKGYTKFEK
jgi:Domain of unknown function (DUF4412)